MIPFFIFLALIAALIVWGIAIYNRLVQLRNRLPNAWAQIDVQLKRRHDLIPNLVQVAARYLKHEQETLQAVTAARGQAQGLLEAARHTPASAAAITAKNAVMKRFLLRATVSRSVRPRAYTFSCTGFG